MVTGTPIHDENQRKMSTTADVFGNELHRYSIADGIRDKNVLGFDPYMVCTYKDKDLRKVVALDRAKASTEAEAIADPKKSKVYYHYMDHTAVPMAGYADNSGQYVKGIEDYVPMSQYDRKEHRDMVVKDILDNWETLSRAKKFHAIFATGSIPEAIEYYRLFKAQNSGLKIAALFDQNIDNTEGVALKEDAVVEMLTDYNRQFGQSFTIPSYQKYKKDVSLRLAHKKPYLGINRHPEMELDLLIVVDQMLTGFDSKWVNTLYLDKLMRYENIIQAFSRTNRLFGPEKPFGTIRYYRKPHTMKRNIRSAVKLYSGDKPLGLFVDKLEENIQSMNEVYQDIFELYETAGVKNFEKLPEEKAAKARFALLFKGFEAYLEAAKVQGFAWKKTEYFFKREDDTQTSVTVALDERTYLTLVQRYKELVTTDAVSGDDVPYDIEGYITEINTDAIDADYMNANFTKWRKQLQEGASKEEIEQTLNELHKSFASMTQEEQKYANLFLHDVESGEVQVEEGKTLRDYITEYQTNAKNDQIHRFAIAVGVNEDSLRAIMAIHPTEATINEYGRFDALKASVDIKIAQQYFESAEGKPIPTFKINIKLDELLRKFIFAGGFEILRRRT